MIWTSTWRPPATTRSMKSVASPNELAASAPGRLEGALKLAVGLDPPDPPAATAGGGLDHERVADGRLGACAPLARRPPAHRSRRPRVPRQDSASRLAPDLVTEPPHDLTRSGR